METKKQSFADWQKQTREFLGIVTLSNGKRVANFSSPHPFTFTDGTVLPAVDPETSQLLKIDFIETEIGNGDISLEFELSGKVRGAMKEWQDAYNGNLVDVVFCPLPMITAMRSAGINVKSTPFRAVRIEDRVNKLVSIDKQCI